MPAFILVQIRITDPAQYERYKAMAPDSIAQYGGRYIARGGATDALEGNWAPSRLVILEFPSTEQAKAWWSSPEYADAKALRQASADTEMLLIDGLG